MAQKGFAVKMLYNDYENIIKMPNNICEVRECELGHKKMFHSLPWERMKPVQIFDQSQNVLFYAKKKFSTECSRMFRPFSENLWGKRDGIIYN